MFFVSGKAGDCVAIGLMSGTSLDGLDIAAVRLTTDGAGAWGYALLAAETVAYDDRWVGLLGGAYGMGGADLMGLDVDFGRWMGEQAGYFMGRHNIAADLVCSHGHTVYHAPERGLTVQIGSGAAVWGGCGVPVVCDFRSADVALGGQGAPLVPVGDALLFGEWAGCLNLGGIANVSFCDGSGVRRAMDVCAVNMVLNGLAERVGLRFDADGELARGGKVIGSVLRGLEGLDFYGLSGPKSIGREWVEAEVLPLLDGDYAVGDLLHTYVVHACRVLGGCVGDVLGGGDGILVTGGGAYNGFFMECLREAAPGFDFFVPERGVVGYKEAIVFALLGVLRARGEVNCYASVTGATRDVCGGVIWGGGAIGVGS